MITAYSDPLNLITMAISKMAAIADYVQSEYGDTIKNSEDPAATLKYYTEYYTSGSGSEGTDNMVNEYQYYCDLIDSELATIKEAVTQFTSIKAMPAVLVVGQATGTVNPGYATGLGGGMKATLKGLIIFLKDVLRKLELQGKAMRSTTYSADIASYNAQISAAEATVNSL